MLTDYHVHLERGPLTLEWLGQFVRVAETKGIGDFGISEHGHRFREMEPVMGHIANGEGAWPVFTEWLSHHFKDSVYAYLDLMKKGSKVFNRCLKTGLEMDYFPEYEEKIAEIVKGLDLDYVLGSVHFLGMWGFDHSASVGWPERDVDEVYTCYFETMDKMINSGIFDIVSHPDVIKIFGHKPKRDITNDYHKLAESIKRMDMCAEVSTAGLRKPVKEMYPSKEFLTVLREHDVPITLSSDAHEPGDVAFNYEFAVAYVKTCGYSENAVFKNRKYELVPLL